MPIQLSTSKSPVADQIKQAIEAAIDDAQVQVRDHGGRHFSIVVRSASFAGQRTLQRHRAVMRTLKDLMAGGDAAPVHAVDSLQTLTPE